MLVGMTYLTYGPAPTSHYRIVGSPGDSLLATPLDGERRSLAAFGSTVRSISRGAFHVARVVAIALAVGAAAMAVRVGAYYLGHQGGLF
jgi:hypothetical protein